MEKIQPTAEETLFNRFDNLLSLISEGHTGWVQKPDGIMYADGERIPIRIFAFNPQKLPADYESQYSPSLYLELGERSYAEDGKPVGEVIKLGLKRDNLELSPKNDEIRKQKAEQELEIIEEIYFKYLNSR